MGGKGFCKVANRLCPLAPDHIGVGTGGFLEPGFPEFLVGVQQGLCFRNTCCDVVVVVDDGLFGVVLFGKRILGGLLVVPPLVAHLPVLDFVLFLQADGVAQDLAGVALGEVIDRLRNEWVCILSDRRIGEVGLPAGVAREIAHGHVWMCRGDPLRHGGHVGHELARLVLVGASTHVNDQQQRQAAVDDGIQMAVVLGKFVLALATFDIGPVEIDGGVAEALGLEFAGQVLVLIQIPGHDDDAGDGSGWRWGCLAGQRNQRNKNGGNAENFFHESAERKVP